MVILLCKDKMSTEEVLLLNGHATNAYVTESKRSTAAANGSGVEFAISSQTDLDGPDQVLSSDSISTTEAAGRVRIEFEKNGIADHVPISVPGLLAKTARENPDFPALVSREGVDGRRVTYTFKEYHNQVRIVARAFLKLGLERHHSVCILGFNSPEWFISDLAAIHAGGFASGIYTTNSAEACLYCAERSRANIIVVEDSKQLEKILAIKSKLPLLKAIVQYDGVPTQKGVLSWNELLEIGKNESDDKLDSVLRTICINECCTLVFTSGTVGNPKAVMLSHDNLIYDAKAIITSARLTPRTDRLVSFLPLSHVAAQVVDIYAGLAIVGTIYFADKNALKGTLIDTLQVAKPTAFLGVPRVWEKIYEKMQAVARNNGVIKTWIANWAKAQALDYNINKMNGVDYKSWSYLLAKWLIFGKIKSTLGLDKCNIFVTAAAPLSTEVKRYFMSLDIPIMEAFGMSECAGAHTLSQNDNYRLGSVGPVMPGLHLKIDKPDATGEGEVCMKGRHTFMGYLEEPEKTRDTKDDEGWLHSGDLGRYDKDGFLWMTGRIKELIITAGGENIPPVHIEHLVLAELPALSNALLVGDMRKYLTILVTLQTDLNPETGAPLDTLSPLTLSWAKSIGSKAKTVTEVIQSKDPAIHKEIEEAIKRANSHATSNAQKVQKFRILPHDFSVPTGELGPTLKVKRNVVLKMYADLIEEMYK
ncbi:very long-chain-fatty-acid--CoA ligase bubblegum isoform X1 [Neodiprion lecontei]|uniref:long-chain-fatty-acid--CoA ligase n=2 Tax=Neodiprion lecontei TaxID=441921 RepID=A0A6J0BU65_NEOLC|nr:very long-chain-fatty-acid--CoA ligase bubblegum isoform X1 [Neodiprion lecontei]